eukprot:3940799-Alexandrium_andersonii.AAC.1
MALHKELDLKAAMERFEDHCRDPNYKKQIINKMPCLGVFKGATVAVGDRQENEREWKRGKAINDHGDMDTARHLAEQASSSAASLADAQTRAA